MNKTVKMNTLIVSAHPEPASFGGQLVKVATETLEQLNHTVRSIDLYAKAFDPVMRASQFSPRKDTNYFETMAEQAHQSERGLTSGDVKISQEQLLWCENLLLHFPLWWWSMPAMMKGWIERVFAADFAYGKQNLAGRRALLLVTAETKGERFAIEGGAHPLHHIERGMLRFCGFEVLPAFVIADVWKLTQAQRSQRLSDLPLHLRRAFADSRSETKGPPRGDAK